jgi:hypothetical protein
VKKFTIALILGIVIFFIVIVGGVVVYTKYSKSKALEQAREYKPPEGTVCATVMTPAIHQKTGLKYTFDSSCLPEGWVENRLSQGNLE